MMRMIMVTGSAGPGPNDDDGCRAVLLERDGLGALAVRERDEVCAGLRCVDFDFLLFEIVFCALLLEPPGRVRCLFFPEVCTDLSLADLFLVVIFLEGMAFERGEGGKRWMVRACGKRWGRRRCGERLRARVSALRAGAAR